MDQQVEAISLVKSARAGDQNAMDMLRLIGINARKGNAKAVQTQKYMSDFITDNPVSSPKTEMGEEATIMCGVLMTCSDWEVPSWLSDLNQLGGENLTNPRIMEMANGLDEGKRKLFLWGVCACVDDGPSARLLAKQPDDIKGTALAGKVVGQAQLIQMVINGAPISKLSEQAGLEHGE
jgi:hypothetical protein